MPRCQSLRRQVIQHIIHLDGISIKTVVNFGALNQIADVGQIVRMLLHQWECGASALDVDTAKGDLTQVAFRCCGCTKGQDDLAETRKVRVVSHQRVLLFLRQIKHELAHQFPQKPCPGGVPSSACHAFSASAFGSTIGVGQCHPYGFPGLQ